MTQPSPALELEGLHVSFAARSRRRQAAVLAVRGVDLRVARGEMLGLVGESGSGKSTIARAIVGIVSPSGGRILADGRDLVAQRSDDPRAVARRVQMVFQDVLGALDPRQSIADALREVLRVHGLCTPDDPQGHRRTEELLDMVGLAAEHARRFPHQLSGGQRQRAGIARALAVTPDILILDEPVSSLDVSIQAQILALVDDLRARLGLTVLLIAHDLAVVRNVCTRVAVLFGGRIVEIAPTSALYEAPRHPCSRDLIEAMPRLGESLKRGPSYDPSAVVVERGFAADGCPYHLRCRHPGRDEACLTAIPGLAPVGPGHFAACVKESGPAFPGVDT